MLARLDFRSSLLILLLRLLVIILQVALHGSPLGYLMGQYLLLLHEHLKSGSLLVGISSLGFVRVALTF